MAAALKKAARLRHLRLTSVPKHYAEKKYVEESTNYTGFELILLGTGAGMPSIDRGATSVCVQLPRKNWLIDCGEGSLRQIFRSTVRVTTTEKIFLTHVHGDHIFGLPGMLCTLNALNAGYKDSYTKQPIKRPIDVYGPIGVFDYINSALSVSRATLGSIQLNVHELIPAGESAPTLDSQVYHEGIQRSFILPTEQNGSVFWNVVDDGEHTVVAGALKHSVPSYGYVIEEKSKPGRLDAQELTRRGLPPGPLYKKLKEGLPVTLPDGTLLHPHEVSGPSRRGRKAAILGDSSDSSNMYPIAQNVDVLIHEATLASSMGQMAIERGHSTSTMAGHFARKMNATLLVLSHISHRFSMSRLSNRSVQELVDEARYSFQKRAVVDGFDLMRIPIPVPRNTSN